MAGKMTLYGLHTCLSCSKARGWLIKNGIPFAFRDVITQPLNMGELIRVARQQGMKVNYLINTGSPVLTRLNIKIDYLDEEGAIRLLIDNPRIMHRPILGSNDLCIIGFSEETYLCKITGMNK